MNLRPCECYCCKKFLNLEKLQIICKKNYEIIFSRIYLVELLFLKKKGQCKILLQSRYVLNV